jgi:two-component system, chemotaxis family, sensor kinase CheA
MNPLLNQFLEETREFLESISASLLALESAGKDAGQLDLLFRSVHTLKGNSGLFDLPLMSRLLHAAEDLLDAVRQGQIAYSPALADALLEAMDQVGQLTDDAEANEGSQGEQDEQSINACIASLRAWLPRDEIAEVVPKQAPSNVKRLPLPVASLPVELVERTRLACQDQDSAVHWLVYQPNEQCFFTGEDPLLRVRRTPGAWWFGVEDRRAHAGATDDYDCFQCHLSYHVIAQGPVEELRDHYLHVLDECELITLDHQLFASEDAGMSTPERPTAPVRDGTDDGLLQEKPDHLNDLEWHYLTDTLISQREVLSLADSAPWKRGQIAGSANTLHACLESANADTARLKQVTDESRAGDSAHPLSGWLDEMLDSPAIDTDAGAAIAVADLLKDETLKRGDGSQKSRALKVDPEKIERLMNLIGEIVVSKNALPYLAAKADSEYRCPALAREIKSQYGMISRVAEELQDAIFQIRMLPVSFVFQRFPRLVRDITRKLGKQVELVQEGGDTEADKAIIEALSDPLIHVVRNSLDHGIELPADREKAGKPASGTLTLRAGQQSDRILIEVIDDGKGIDPERIRAKAIQRGLITEETAAQLPEQDVLNLVFEPGFSTNDVVSDLSGRGVGMDVVRTAVEQVGGEVALSSKPGEGTRVTLSLPLSMAMTRVMIIHTDDQLFGFPMDAIRETVRLRPEAIRTLGNQQMADLRGELLPLVSLNQALAIERPQQLSPEGEYTVLSVRLGNESIGLIVDEVQEVADMLLKPLPGELSKMSAYAGSSLLGDGTVLMVLNPRGLL